MFLILNPSSDNDELYIHLSRKLGITVTRPSFCYMPRLLCNAQPQFFLPPYPSSHAPFLLSLFRAVVAKAHHRMAQALYYMCSFSLGNFTYLYR